MAQYSTLKAAIAAAIKQNGNKEITGALLQQQLLAMVNSLGAGYQYAGIATPNMDPGTPDQNVFYIATTPGTYSNFSGLVVNPGEIATFLWGGSWEKRTIGISEFNSYTESRWYIEGTGVDPYLLTAESGSVVEPYICSLIIPCKIAVGDAMIWRYAETGTPPNSLMLGLLDDNKKVLAYWLSNSPAGYRTITATENASYIVVSGLNPTVNYYPYLSINGNMVWMPQLGWEYMISQQIKEMQNLPNMFSRIATVCVPSGGSTFTYNQQTGVFTFPANTAIKWKNDGVDILGEIKTVTLTHNFGIVVYNTQTKAIVDRYTGNLGADEYVLFSYNTTRVGYLGDLITSLPQNSVVDENADALRYVDNLGINILLSRAAKYAFPDNVAMPLQLLWFSDVHANEQRIKAITRFKSVLGATFDDVIATGDQVGQYFSDSFDFWAANGANNVLQVIGNHEVWGGGSQYATAAQAYQKYFAPFISNWGVVSAGTDLCYYYKDYTTNKIRLIVLDCMNWDAAQNSWLIATLASAKTAGLHVIIAQHYMAGTPTPIQCNYTAINVVQEGTINDEAPQAVQGFINDGGSFICWIGGHYHADYLYQLADYPAQYGILIGTAATNQREQNNFRQEPAFYNLFSALQIDITYHQIKMVRFGANVDRWMRKKELVSFNYQTGQVIVG